MCPEWHYKTGGYDRWRHDDEPAMRVVITPYVNPRTMWCHSKHTPYIFYITPSYVNISQTHTCQNIVVLRHSTMLFALAFRFEVCAYAIAARGVNATPTVMTTIVNLNESREHMIIELWKRGFH